MGYFLLKKAASARNDESLRLSHFVHLRSIFQDRSPKRPPTRDVPALCAGRGEAHARAEQSGGAGALIVFYFGIFPKIAGN